MSQYRGYYTSTKKDIPPSSSSSFPFIVTNDDDDFEYDRSYINCNKRPYDEVETNTNDNNEHPPVKSQKVNNYYSSSSNNYNYNHSSTVTGVSSSSRNISQNVQNSSHNLYLNHNMIKSEQSSATSDPNFAAHSQPSYRSHSISPASTQITPELAMPVFQTVDRYNQWDSVQPKVVTVCDDDITVRSEKSEQWAWGNGKKWVGASGPKPRLNIYKGAPTADMINNAARVTGGIGEKMLQKMGWKEGEGLGKSKEGGTEPIQFFEIKTDRKGLVSQEDEQLNLGVETNVQERTKSKFSEIKSSSFWNWQGTGMKGPENLKDRMKNCKKVAKEKAPPTLDLSGKHPVSALMELCSKKRWNEPKFIAEISSTGFKFNVEVNGTLYSPSTNSDTKKSAKAESARNCMAKMGWNLS